jgi:hypothetical protein
MAGGGGYREWGQAGQQSTASASAGRVARPAVHLPGQWANLDPPILGDIDPLIVPKRVEIFR